MISYLRAVWPRAMAGLAVGALFVSATSGAALSPGAGAVVTVTGGKIRGRADDGTLTFYAIPFAAPPVRGLRWKPPAAVIPWQGTRDATRSGPSCLQNNENWNRNDWLRGDEDCLTVNVRTPALAGKRPVMVWIHGGSNRAGSGFGPVESSLVRHDMVVVSLQYRLGILGFLSHRALAAEQGGASGNYGLMDQIAALRWVRDNIGTFGGDPTQVTIFGESAGSQDVSLMLAAPEAQGLFRAAIMQSGTPGFGMTFRSHDDALKLGDQLDTLSDSGGRIEKLRQLSPVALFSMQSQLSEPESKGNDFLFLRTTIDGRVLPDTPDRLLARATPKPVIIGTDKVEFGPGPGGAPLEEFSRFWFGGKAAPALAAYRAEELAGADKRRGNLELRMQSDAQFHCPANRVASLLTKLGWPVWRYEFDVGENGGLTRHAYEIGYIFDRKAVGGGVQMQDYWVALAARQDPNAMLPTTAKRPPWTALSGRKESTMEFGNSNSGEAASQPRSAYCGWSAAF